VKGEIQCDYGVHAVFITACIFYLMGAFLICGEYIN
jgi:hypothetical protein